jgi:peptidoglycan-associated lipoprotein
MRWSGGVGRACRFAGVVAIALVLAACSRQAQPRQYGLGGEGPVTPGTERDFAVNVGDIVHFAEDSSALSGEAQGILRNQARWLNQYPQYTITVEGHADERGTREYNLALGARRATAVKSFLGQTGVNAGRIRTVSYGKERPVATCDAPTCWNQNRRAQTVLNDRGGAIARNY